MSKKIRNIEKEYRIPRLIITISLLVLIVAYIIVFTVQGFKVDSVACAIIAMASGIFLTTLGVVIKRQDRRVDLDYDSIVVWKMCVVSGILVIAFGIICLVMCFQ